jgi:hypothetical protein
MKTMNKLKVLTGVLLLAVLQPLRAQKADTTTRLSQENQEQMTYPPRWRGFAIRAAENLNLRFLIV